MVFSSTFFLFFFLPALLVFYGAARSLRLRNAVLLVASLAFYAWGELGYVFLLLGSIGANYGFGLWIAGAVERGAARRALVVAVATNLGLLGVVKYTHMFVGWAGVALGALGVAQVDPMPPLHLPLGISFYTLQTLGYTLDVHRGRISARRSFLDVAVYVSFFPQLVAGPILRAGTFLPQLDTAQRFARRRVHSICQRVASVGTVVR